VLLPKHPVLRLLAFLIVMCLVAATYAQNASVIVVAPAGNNHATNMEAQSVMRANNWTQGYDPRQSDGVLVAVRSSRFWPLADQYENLDTVRNAAEWNEQHDGYSFHVYLYQINQDLSLSQIAYESYATASRCYLSSNPCWFDESWRRLEVIRY